MEGIAELKPFTAELALSKRWFEQARQTALRGEWQAAQHCLERGLRILDRVEAALLAARAAVEVQP
jgi:hypothetical protein